jgi:hypothetical protein
MDDPLRVRVVGRAGAGRRSVATALRGAGIAVADPDADADVEVYVFVETLNGDDRAALAASDRPTVAVLNKIDLAGFPDGADLGLHVGGGQPAPSAGRCGRLQRETGVPVRPFSALLAVAGTDRDVLNDATLRALQALAAGAVPDQSSRRRLAADLDVFGTALAVAALRCGAGRSAIAERLCSVSGLADVLTAVDRAGAVVRYRRALGPARMAAAAAVLDAAGATAPGATNHLARAIHRYRYARGPVSAVHRSCALDAARADLQRWVRAGGRPAALP